MVMELKKTIQQVPSRGRRSIMRIQHFTIERKQSVIRVVYGVLFLSIAVIMAIIDPVEITSEALTRVRQDSFLFKLYQKPPYDLFCEVRLFNYTNVPEYLNGDAKILKLDEVGPFLFQETRTNENMLVHEDGGMTFSPKIRLDFVEEKSVSHYKDVNLTVPNIALVAMSTLFADKLGYFPNVAAYYSMKTIGSKLFLDLNGEDLLWGYKDPVVTLANNFLPGWIDFDKIGIMDRFYAERNDIVEVEVQDKKTKFAIKNFNNSPGLKEQGFKDLNTSIPCNTIRGSYEGLLITPPVKKEAIIPIFRRQACRIIPFKFLEENTQKFGFNVYKFMLQDTAFNKTSDFACPCAEGDACLPDGFIDVSNCYYGFPIVLSKPHFQDTDPKAMANFKGMRPDPEKYMSLLEIEPTLGVPLALKINIQVNVAVRMNAGNPITKPLDGKVLPLMWISLYCKEPPTRIVNLIRLRIVFGPPMVIVLEVVLFIIGLVLSVQGFHRIWKPKYRLIEPELPTKDDDIVIPKRRKSAERRLSSVILNMTDNIGFHKDDEELAKQAVSLLAITEEDNDLPDMFIPID